MTLYSHGADFDDTHRKICACDNLAIHIEMQRLVIEEEILYLLANTCPYTITACKIMRFIAIIWGMVISSTPISVSISIISYFMLQPVERKQYPLYILVSACKKDQGYSNRTVTY